MHLEAKCILRQRRQNTFFSDEADNAEGQLAGSRNWIPKTYHVSTKGFGLPSGYNIRAP